MINNENFETQTEYNLNLSKTDLIAKQQYFATTNYINCSYIQSFQCWKSIRLLITNRLTLGALKICKHYERIVLSKGGKIDKFGKYRRNTYFVMHLDKYIEIIQFYMRKTGLDIVDKQDQSLF